jgi:hypothetical protein
MTAEESLELAKKHLSPENLDAEAVARAVENYVEAVAEYLET